MLDSVSLLASFLTSNNCSVSSGLSWCNICLLTSGFPNITLSILSLINSLFGSFISLLIDNLFVINLAPEIPAVYANPPRVVAIAFAGLVVKLA